MSDVTFVVELCITFVALVGFILFAWWWYKNKQATIVYAYVTCLFLSEIIIHAFQAYARYMRDSDWQEYLHILESPLWPLRLFLHGLILFAVVLHVVHRIVQSYSRVKKLRRRLGAVLDKDFKEEMIIVDDHEEIFDILEKGLKSAFPNIKVYQAISGEEAIELFSNKPEVNLILSDLYLGGGMNGFELCEVVKKQCPWTIMIAMTGYPHAYEFWNARQIGFDDYIQKPFSVRSLVDIVRREFHKLETWKAVRVSNQNSKERRQTDVRS